MITNIPTVVPYFNHELRIAITGQMRAGKDTVANAVDLQLKQSGYAIKKYAFGDSLKYFAKELFPDEFKNNQKPRELFQWFGQTLRQRDENIWINQVANNISRLNHLENSENKYKSETTHLAHIITDLRQPNEYEFCKLNNFIIIKVVCDDEIRIKRMQELDDSFKPEHLSHETENHLQYFKSDYTVDTTYLTEEQLNETIKAFTKQLIKRQFTGGK